MGCRECQGEDHGEQLRHPPAAYHALARERGIAWLGPDVKGALEPTVWECVNGHRWSARYNTVQQGYGCKFCSAQRKAEKTRRKPTDYFALAAKRGFTWLGPVVKRISQKTHWRCNVGHLLFKSFNEVSTKRSCIECSGLAPKTAQDFSDLAASRDFKWIGEKACNTGTRTRWQCGAGHKWQAS